MADVKKIATRESYGNTLKELAAEGHEDLVVLDADLAAATKTGMFRKASPDRHCRGKHDGRGCGPVHHGLRALCFQLCHVRRRPRLRAGAQLHWLSPPEREDRCHPRRHLGGRGRRFPSVLRGLCPHAQHPRHDRDLPRRRCGGPRRCACCLRNGRPRLPALWPFGCACVPRCRELSL